MRGRVFFRYRESRLVFREKSLLPKRKERALPGASIVGLLFTFSYCIVLHAFSLMSLAFIHGLDATSLLLSRFSMISLEDIMHMRASESHRYSLSFSCSQPMDSHLK